MTRPLNVVLVGLGAIGQGVLPLLAAEPGIRLAGVLVRPGGEAAARQALARLAAERQAGPTPAAGGAAYSTQGGSHAGNPPDTPPAVATTLAELPRPDLLVECAGHAAITGHVLPALRAGIPCVVASVGALSAPGLVDELDAAARAGGTRLTLVAGAIGAIDALAAARLGGLQQVRYTGTKPARAWAGTPAEQQLDLATLVESACFFEGTARQAAAQFPKNANVAATVALAGLGLDATTVRLVADPHATENTHHVEAHGAFGRFELTMVGRPLAANPKTSALTVYSVARAVLNHGRALVI